MQAYLQLQRIVQMTIFLQGWATQTNILPASKACYYSLQEDSSVEDNLTKTPHIPPNGERGSFA